MYFFQIALITDNQRNFLSPNSERTAQFYAEIWYHFYRQFFDRIHSLTQCHKLHHTSQNQLRTTPLHQLTPSHKTVLQLNDKPTKETMKLALFLTIPTLIAAQQSSVRGVATTSSRQLDEWGDDAWGSSDSGSSGKSGKSGGSASSGDGWETVSYFAVVVV